MTDKPFKVFIVDDEASARMATEFALEDTPYQMSDFDSGERCLAALDQAPDVILLDVEMSGMDGITTCKELRAQGWQGHAIFISSHDDMETRLHAYDAGGNDFIVKPFNSEELLQKVRIAEKTLSQRSGLEEQVQRATHTAFSAMSSMGELGAVIQFLRVSFACETPEQLIAALIEAMNHYGLQALVEVRLAELETHASCQGTCSELEKSILTHARTMGHVFQFHSRMVINYPMVTLVVSNLPLEDPDFVGRLRDHLAILGEGANARVQSLLSERQRRRQSQSVGEAVAELTDLLNQLEKQETVQRLNVLEVMERYLVSLEQSFVHLELSQKQEESLAQMARMAVANVGDQLGESRDANSRLFRIAARLRLTIE